jgi:uncharacterized 2Fe-2S/4Fe-4S cluster protein (DUF4445 family)
MRIYSYSMWVNRIELRLNYCMPNSEIHTKTPHAGKGLAGIQRFWPLDEGAWGYGSALYIGTSTITYRLYNLQTDELLETEKRTGDFGAMTNDELNETLIDALNALVAKTDVCLSEINTVIISGTTAMECIVSGVGVEALEGSGDDQLNLFGCDIDYLIAGKQSVAAGEAYFAPCLSAKVGGDFACSLLAIDILQAQKPLLFVNTGPDASANTVIAYGYKDSIAVCAVPHGMDADEGIEKLLTLCGVTMSDVDMLLLTGGVEAKIPAELQSHVRHVGNAAIEGTSAVLLSETAEDELCRIVDACRIVVI